MEISERSFSAHHLTVYAGLAEAVKEYQRIREQIQALPKPPTKSEGSESGPPNELDIYRSGHYSRLAQKRATVIMLAASCVEALANLYLAQRATREQFEVLERAKIIEKWVVLPSLFLPSYVFPKDRQLYCDLKQLCKQRDALMHLKEEVTVGGELVHKGNLPEPASSDEAFIGRCAGLPLELVQHVSSFDSTGVVQDMLASLAWGMVMQGWSELLGGEETELVKWLRRRGIGVENAGSVDVALIATEASE